MPTNDHRGWTKSCEPANRVGRTLAARKTKAKLVKCDALLHHASLAYQTGQFLGIPQRDERIGRTGGKVFPRWIEFNANARARMRFQHVLQLQIRVTENVHATLAIGQEEQIAFVVPRDFVHLEIELLLGTDFMRSRIDECDQILFVAHGNRVAIRWPCDVDIFPFGIDCRCIFAGANIPNADSLIATCRWEQIGQSGVPAQLIDGTSVSAECGIFGLRNVWKSGCVRFGCQWLSPTV